MKKLKPKETHLIVSICIGIIVFVTLLILGLKKIIINPQQLATTLLTTSGIFIGFIISALGIYYSIPLRAEIKAALTQQGYYKQVSRNFIISTVLFATVSIIAILSICIYNAEKYLLFQHILNTLMISLFTAGIILLVCVSINFFKIVSKN